MEKIITKLGGCENQVVIILSKEELQPHYQKAYVKARPEIDMKGFRKGKVPIPVIKKYYGAQIEHDAQQDIVSDEFAKIVQEEKIAMIGQPALTNIEPEGDGIKFTVSFETLPDVELEDYKGIKVDEPVHAVQDTEIQEELDRIAIQNGKFAPADTVVDDQHMVTAKLSEIDTETKEIKKDKPAQDLNIYLADKTVLPALKEGFLNKKAGDSFEFNPSETDTNAPNSLFNIEITAVQKLTPVEFTDEFVKEYTKEKFDKVEDFRSEIGFNIQDRWDQRSRQEVENQIIDQLVDKNDDIPVPESIVKQVMETMVEDFKKRYANAPELAETLTVEKMGDDLRPVAERNVRWEVIRNNIIEQEELKVEDHDIEELITAEVERTKSDRDTVKDMIMKNPNIVNNLLVKKVMDFLMDFTITNEVAFPEDHEVEAGTEEEIEENKDSE